ncbi:MAG: hypothetical protein GY810_10225 [Aureispira sp.]|nr:hypothetical protein [Aureispira sp.]
MKKNIGRLHSYYGYIYPANKVIKFNEMLPMPFGEVSIPAKGTLKVVEEGDEIKFLGSLNIDRKKGKEALIEMIKSMIEKMGSNIEPAKREKMEAEMEKMLFNIDDEEYTLYDKFSG